MRTRSGPLRLIARLVPAARREAWLQEWAAELAVSGDREPARVPLSVVLAAAEDAVGIRLRSLRPRGAATDLRYTLRSLARRPGFTLVVVLTLALGLGANVAIFSAVRGVALRPLPFDQPERLAIVSMAFGTGPFPASVPEYLELKAEHPALEDLAAFYASDSNLGGVGSPRRVTSVAGTANLLEVLGVEPALGRAFAPGEDRPGAPRLALLTHDLWRDSYGADPDVIGRTVLVDERPRTVIGVLAPDFEFPGVEADVMLSLQIDPANPGGRSSHWLSMIGRLRPGTDVAAARTLTTELVDRWNELHPDRHGADNEGHPVLVTGLREFMVGDLDRPLLVLSGAVLLVLLVACLNVANLVLVRGEDRQREFGLRTALGAGRATLARQLLLESAVLAGAGGVVGVGLGWLALRTMPQMVAGALPPNASLSLDGTVLLFAAGLTGLVALSFGLVPLSSTVGDVAARLRDGGAHASAGRRRLLFRRGVIVLQVAAAVALLAGAGVLVRSFGELMSVDPGLDPTGVALLEVELTTGSYPEVEDVAAFHAELKRRVEALPGVVAAGSIRTVPLDPEGGWESLEVLGETPPDEDDGHSWTVQYQVADPGVFQALGIPLLRGRGLENGDVEGAQPVVVLNERAARALYGDQDPIGRELRLGHFPDNPNQVMTVVGIVGDVRQRGLDADPPPQIYAARAQAAGSYGGTSTRFATVVVRTAGDPSETLRSVTAVIRDLDPELPVAGSRTLEEQLARSVGDRRFMASLMGLFSLTAALLGAVGLYGLMAYVVRRRSLEFGIRYALGAARRRVVGGVVAEAGLLVALGAAIGVVTAWWAGGLLEELAYGVSARDPLTLAGAPLLLIAVGVLAAWLPARRASAIDPVRVLREE